jgi:hypothetical protein
MFIAEKSASHRYDVAKGQSASIAFFVILGTSCRRDIQNETISVDECFIFSPLSFLISFPTVNSSDSNELNIKGSLSQLKEDTSSDEK